MTSYPVHYHVDPPLKFERLQLLIRVVAFCALGILGLSIGTVFLFAFVALPVFAASRLSSRTPEQYTAQDGPKVIGALRWLAAISAWVGLTADRLPLHAASESVRLEVSPTARPTSRSAIWRVLTGLPSVFVLAVLCWVGTFVWVWAAASIMFNERVGQGAFHYLVGLQRWSVRLLAYQASLVDEYPPFSFDDTPTPALPTAQVIR